MPNARRDASRRASLVVALASMVLVVGLVQPASGTHSTVTAVKGFAYGYELEASLFGGPVNTRGYGQVTCISTNNPPGCVSNPEPASTPSVELPSSGGSLSQTDPDGSMGSVGPATLFSSGTTTVSTQGTTGATGAAKTSTSTDNVNRSGQEQFSAANLASSCAASGSGLSASTTITRGTLEIDSGEDLNNDGDYDDAGEHRPVVVTLPTSPAPSAPHDRTSPAPVGVYEGHVHVNGAVDQWRYAFNEQVVNADGSITVYAAHQYLLGPTAVGDVWVGRADCGVTTVQGSHPTAVDDAYSTSEDVALTVSAPGVLGNDVEDRGALAAAVATGPSNGRVTLSPDGSFGYTPNADFNGPDSFTYTASDGNGGSATAKVTITVAAVNDAPRAVDDAYTANANQTLSVARPGVLANDTDVDGDALTAALAAAPSNGSVTLNADGSFDYTPSANFVGTDTFTYTAGDGNGGSATAMVSIEVKVPAVADLVVRITGPQQVAPGGTATYTVNVTNDGPARATEVKLSDTTVTGGSLVSVTPGAPTCSVSKGKTKVITCNLGDLAPGASTTVTVVAQAPKKPGTMSIRATASSNVPDPDSTNNSNITHSTAIVR